MKKNRKLKNLVNQLQILGIDEEDKEEVAEAIQNYTYSRFKVGYNKGRYEGVKEGFNKGLFYTGRIRV